MPQILPVPKLLVVEDHAAIARQLAAFFDGLGWLSDYAVNGAQAINLGAHNPYDIVVLDLGLPDMDGVDVCKALKAQSHYALPIIMLTARDAIADKASGFGAGADDYLTKPFALEELRLRCLALMRRKNLYLDDELRVGELALFRGQRRAVRAGQELILTQVGFTILQVLVEAYPDAVSRSVLTHKVWGGSPPESDALRSHIYMVRNALDKPFSKPMLKTRTNVGYQLTLAYAD